MGFFAAWIQALFDFAFYYPLYMSYVWMIGGLIYYVRREQKDKNYYEQPALSRYPPVTIVVPCHNEGDNLYETIGWLVRQNYPDFKIIAINDGSRDNTKEILDGLEAKHPQLTVIHFAKNQGKAMGLRMAALFSPHEYLICIDGDALLDVNAVAWMMRHFISGPRVGAVTGNPRIRNRSTLLGKIQVGEFTSIIGLIKRAQRSYGKIFTVSGVIVGFRKAALHSVGYWSTDMVTEDIDISWKLQLRHWDIRYEPNALCWILMPETLKGLWRQRLRWAQGGCEVMLRYAFSVFTQWRHHRMWLLAIELAVSVFWAYVMALIVMLWLAGWVAPLPDYLVINNFFSGWNGVVLGLTCLVQFAISLLIDSRYEPAISKHYYWMIWYPMVYWFISATTTVVALPKALFKRRGKRAVWVSPDRGLRPEQSSP